MVLFLRRRTRSDACGHFSVRAGCVCPVKKSACTIYIREKKTLVNLRMNNTELDVIQNWSNRVSSTAADLTTPLFVPRASTAEYGVGVCAVQKNRSTLPAIANWSIERTCVPTPTRSRQRRRFEFGPRVSWKLYNEAVCSVPISILLLPGGPLLITITDGMLQTRTE
jgi:hypothetical protein